MMNRLLFLSILTICVFLSYQHISKAACTEGPTDTFTCDTNAPNPDPDGVQEDGNDNNLIVNMLQGSEINSNNTNAIGLGNGNNIVSLTDASVTGLSDALSLGSGNNTVTAVRSTLVGNNSDAISMKGSGLINVIESNLAGNPGGGDGVSMSGSGPLVVNVSGSKISGGSDALCLTGGDDNVMVERSILDAGSDSIFFGGGNDTVTLKTSADLKGSIQCSGGFDRIIFAMEVPAEFIPEVSQRIATAGLPDGSIIINGLYYEWENCELLVNQIVPGNPGRVTPIPTLSQWGLVAMAGIIGIAGLIAVRRRTASKTY